MFEDKLSGKDTKRPALKAMLTHVREGDMVVIHALDRLGRNLDDLRRLVSDLTGRGVRVQFIKESLTFTGEDSPMSTLLLNVMASFAEFERSLIRERQMEGIQLAKKQGVYKGRKPSLSAERAANLRKRVAAGNVNKADLAREFGISRAALYVYLASAPV